MIQVTLNPTTPEQVQLLGQLLQLYSGVIGGAKAAPAEEAAAPAPKRVKKVAETAVVTPEPTASAPTASEQTSAPTEAAPAPAAASAPAPASTVTLEQVRAKLAELSRDPAKKDSVKDLIGRFGVTKLTDIPADRYQELLLAAEVL